MPRLLTIVLSVIALLVPLAFTSLSGPAEERVRDAKALALQTGDFGPWSAHEVLDAEKERRVEAAMTAAEDLGVSLPTSAECTGGFAGPYPCENVDLAAVVPLAELGGAAGNDSWGWTDPEEGREIAIVGTGTGVAFVDVTEPTDPVVLGRVQSRGGAQVEGRPVGSVATGVDYGAVWRDVKVDDDHAFIVSENYEHGMQVFDLTRLREFYGTHNPGNLLSPDHVDTSFGNAHNIAINTETDTAYVIGSNVCNAGLHMIDISDPTDTEVAGCFGDDGYTHDVQCVVYRGPDDDHNGLPGAGDDRAPIGHPEGPHEICFASNEDTVTIVDVTDKSAPRQLARIGYETAGYTHQGWLTPDHRFFVFNDELDEQRGTVDNTTTYMMELTDLDLGEVPDGMATGLVQAYAHDSTSTDHNLYITDVNPEIGADRPLIWQANYNAGLQVFTYTDEGLREGELERVGYFRIDSVADAPHYGDSWNVYPYFESGTVIVSNIGQGLMVFRPDHEAMTADDDS